MNLRQDTTTDDWPLRPWIMAAICAAAGLLFHLLTDHSYAEPLAPLRQAGATFVAIAAISFGLTVEQRRWEWSLYFALGWGVVIALVGWFTASYNQSPTVFEFPFLSGIFAVLLAAPLFQTMRDEGGRRLPYRRLHGHAWTDAVIGAASLVFVGIAWLLAWLIASLFDLIGIDQVKDLLEEEWFGWMLAGFAFGTAVGLLRERDALVVTLQRLVMVVLAVLAPVLAVALIAFLASVPFTGLDELWDSIVPATPLMLVAAAGAILLANAVIGDGEEDKPANRALRLAAPALALAVLPLAIIAALSLAQRIGQYGWTPERIWGVVAVGVAVVYGIAGWWSVAKGRAGFDDVLRPLQTRMALGLCGLALFLALPIVDFGSISARSQLARLENGSVRADEFDWAAMAFDFGPAGRERLERIVASGAAGQRTLAATALAAEERFDLTQGRMLAGPRPKDLNVVPDNFTVPPELRAQLLGGPGIKDPFCAEGGECRVFPQQGGATYVVFLDGCANLSAKSRNDPKVDCSRSPAVFERKAGKWVDVLATLDNASPTMTDVEEVASLQRESAAMESGDVKIEMVTRRQLVVWGKKAGKAFE